MTIFDWIRIILMVLEFINEGMSKQDAINKTSESTGAGAAAIKEHIGL